MADDRIDRLRALIGQLERSPASARREWMVAETRRRLADLQAGDATEPMRPFDTGGVDPRASEPRLPRARPERPKPRPAPTAPPPPRREPPPPTAATPVADDEILWLDSSDDDDPPPDEGTAPWRRGLRG